MLTRLQLLKKRAVDAAKDMRLFASFVADTEFFAEQNPECFCSKKAADAYSGLWLELEIVNACALSDCEKEEPGAHQGIWDAKYRADARLAISRLVGYLDSQAGQIPGGVRAKAQDNLSIMLVRHDGGLGLCELMVEARTVWLSYAWSVLVQDAVLLEVSGRLAAYGQRFPDTCEVVLGMGGVPGEGGGLVVVSVVSTDGYSGNLVVGAAKAGADGTECEPAQIATELGLLEGFGRRLGGLLGAAPGHRVSLNH